MELGLYTFAERTPDPAHRPVGQRRRAPARSARGGRAGRPAGARRVRRRRASPPRVRGLGAGGGAGRGRRAHQADQADQRRDRAQLGRPGARVPAVRDARPALRRPGRDHGRARARSSSRSRCSATTWTTTTSCSPRSSTCCWRCARASGSPGRACTARRSTTSASTPSPMQADPDLDRGRRHTRRRWCGPARWACRWRWRSSAACPSGSRPWSSCTGAPRRRPATPELAAQHQLPRLHRRHPARPPSTTRSRRWRSVMDKIGRERGWPPMTREQYEASADAARRQLPGQPRSRWSRRSCSSTRSSATTGSCSSSRVGSMPHDKVMHAIELYGTEVAPAVRAELARRGYSPAEVPT